MKKYARIEIHNMRSNSFQFTEGYEPFFCEGKFISVFLVKNEKETKIEMVGHRDHSLQLESPFSLN